MKKTFTLLIALLTLCSVAFSASYTIKVYSATATAVGAIATNTQQVIGTGSWYNNPAFASPPTSTANKMELYLPLADLGTFTIDQIASLSFSTKKMAPVGTNVDFYWSIYTNPYTGGFASWYGQRLTSEPMYYNGYNAPYNAWSSYQTTGTTNQMTFFDSNHSPYGYSGAPTLTDIQSGPINFNYTAPYWTMGSGIDYGAQTVKSISLATGSAWNATMLSYLDDIVITLNNGNVYTYDLEAGNPTPTTQVQPPAATGCDLYDFPVTVKDFSNIGAISLTLNFDPSVLSYQSVTVNPLLAPGLAYPPGVVPGTPTQFRLGYIGTAPILADNDVLFTLHYKLLPAASGGMTNLTWNTDNCEYSGPGGTPVYTSYYLDLDWTIPVRPVKNLNTGVEYCKIQTAIDAASPGHTITVAAGIYSENIIVNKSLTILGPKANVDGCDPSRDGVTGEAIVYPATAAIASGEIFHVTASNVSIKGFTINGDNPALTSGFTSTNGADIDAGEGITVYVDNVNNLTVSNNIFKNLSYFGVTLFGASYSAPATSGHNISHNKFQDFGTYDATSGVDRWGGGVLLYDNQYAAVTNNCMTNVRIGVQTGNFSQANPGAVTSQVIADNTIQSRRRGIFHNLHYSNTSPYTLTNNNLTALANANETAYWDGIMLGSLSVPWTCNGNTIDGAGMTLPTYGYQIWNVASASPALISGGSVSNVTIGVFANNFEGYNSDGGDGAHATVSGVTMTTNVNGIGIRLLDSPSSTSHAQVNLTVTGCTISGGAEGVKFEKTATGIVGGNISANNISASAMGIDVTSLVTSATNGLTLSGNNITVIGQLAGGNPTTGIFLRKITGTTAASIAGNTITGPYYGYLVYNMNTTAQTTITGGTISGIMQGLSAMNIDPAGSGVWAPSNMGVSTITMSGFAGNYPALPNTNFHSGVYVYTGGSNMADAITAAIYKVSVTGTQKVQQDCAGLSFADFSTGSGTRQNITVTECTLTGNYNRGINIRGLNALVNISTSTLTGNGFDPFGPGGNDGFGIIVREGATAVVHNNFITNPATVTAPYIVSAMCTDKGSATNATINATENSLDQNGNTSGWLAYNGSGTLNATCNWWGTAVAASIAATINGVVTYYPSWYTTGGDNLFLPGFQPTGVCQGTPISLTCATDVTEASCQSQGTINTKFANWLGSASALGCAGSLTTTPTNPAAPLACGGSTQVTWNYTSDCGNLTCTKTFTVTAAPAVQITCPADVTVNQTQEKDPFATGYATATNCSEPSVVTYNDDRSNLNLCNATGYITRTWSVTNSCGSTATCQQKITVTDVNDPVLAACPADITKNTDPNACTAVVNYVLPTATDFGYFQGFENPAWLSGNYVNNPSTDWNEYNSPITRVVSGTDGIVSKSGGAHAVINSTSNIIPNTTGATSRLGGYNGTFGTGFISSVDVYFNMSDPRLALGTYGWDLDQAVCNNTGGFLRDFIYHVGGDNTGIYVCVGNGSSDAIPGMTPAEIQAQPHATILTGTPSGWYTMKWESRNDAGFLAVDFTISDASGNLVWTTTITGTDAIATVGGNRYMWFNFIAADKLAIDNTTLLRKPIVTSVPASGTTFAVGTTPVTVTATDACGKTSTCNFNVNVVDNVPPTLNSPPAILTQCVEPAPYADYAAFAQAGGTAGDNCAIDVSSFAFVGDVKSNESCAHRYTITRTYKIKDVNGNWNNCSQVITVNDNTAPTGTAPLGTTGINACYINETTPPQGTPVFDPIAAAAGYTDNCSGTITATLTGTTVTGNNCNWTVTYTFKVADACGNELTGQTIKYTGGNTTPPAVPANGTSTVQCLSAITTPTPPVVTSCGATITPTGPVISDDPASLTCEGTRTYTYTYTACTGVSSVWKFIYTIDHTTAPVVPANVTKTVSCPADAVAPTLLSNVVDQQQLLVATDLTTPNWTDFTSIGQSFTCGTTGWLTQLDLRVGSLVATQNFTLQIYQGNGITGTLLYNGSHSLSATGWQSLTIPQTLAPYLTAGQQYTFWLTSFTYNQLGLLCMHPDVYPGGVSMDGCTSGCSPAYAWQQWPAFDLVFKTYMSVVPVVTDVCGMVIPTPTPTVTNVPEPIVCEGTTTYKYVYTDCSGMSTNWFYTYTVDYSGGLTVPTPGVATVSCPAASQVAPATTSVKDACNRDVSAVLVSHDPAPSCNGDVVWHYTYTACDGTTIVPWTYTYHVVYSGGLTAPVAGASTVFCPAASQVAPSTTDITDACNRNVSAVLVSHDPAPSCNGNVVWHYTYTACDGTTVVPWTYTYHVVYSGGLTAPANGSATVAGPAQAVDPGPPASITDGCGRTVNAVLVGSSTPPACDGTVVWTYRYTACDNVTTADWTFTYTVTKISVSGTLSYYNAVNTSLNGFTVTLNPGGFTSLVSGGAFSFSNLCPGTYTVSVTNTGNKPVGGINSTDAAQVNAWSVTPTPIEKVRYYAGDVVKDDHLLGVDASRIVMYFVTNGNPAWTDRDPWTFWPADPSHLVSANPVSPSTGTAMTLNVSGDLTNQVIYGLCTGDFNRSFAPASMKNTASNTLSLTNGTAIFAKGGAEFDLPVYTESAVNVGAISLIMNFPSDKLEIMGVTLANQANTPVMFNVSGNELRIGWTSVNELPLKAAERLLTLRVKLLNSLAKDETVYFTLAANQLNELADGMAGVIPDVVLNMNGITSSALGVNPVVSNGTLRFANYPNPFIGTTTLAYTLPVAGEVSIEVRDMLGSIVNTLVENAEQAAGDHTLVLDASTLSSGIYLATLKFNTEGQSMTRTIKIVRNH